ncbi:MAG TPA: DUF1559 domain-containing protein [Abditibacteriaceae bacterium]|jgi:prepilin-type N-terminal cleavage/methylation domain-containing protein
MKSRPFSKPRCGFTLIELLVVIAIIALLAAILFPVFARARENARKSACLNNLKQMGVGIAQYVQDFDERYPMSEDATNPGNTNFIGGVNAVVWDNQHWPFRVLPYIKSKQVFICPSMSSSSNNATATPPATSPNECISYWAVGGMFRKPSAAPVAIADLAKPAQTPHLYDNLDAVYEARLVFRPSYKSATTYDPGLPMNTGSSSFRLDRKPVHLEGQNVLYADSHVKFVKPGVLFLQSCPEYPSGTNCTPPAGY